MNTSEGGATVTVINAIIRIILRPLGAGQGVASWP